MSTGAKQFVDGLCTASRPPPLAPPHKGSYARLREGGEGSGGKHDQVAADRWCCDRFGLGSRRVQLSSDGLTAQANLAGQSSDMCDSGQGVPTGLAALQGSQAARAQCMQNQYASGQAGYGEEEGHFAPGSQPTTLFNAGN
jgi:hypothetical protein